MPPDRLPRVRLDDLPTERMQINASMQAARIFVAPLSATDCSPGDETGYLNSAQRQRPAKEQGLEFERSAPPIEHRRSERNG